MDFYKILMGGVGAGMNNFDRLFAEKHGGGAWQLTTLTGALPLSFKSKGEALTDYKIYGTADGAGVETESGEPEGYKLPLTVESGATENLWDGKITSLVLRQVQTDGGQRPAFTITKPGVYTIKCFEDHSGYVYGKGYTISTDTYEAAKWLSLPSYNPNRRVTITATVDADHIFMVYYPLNVSMPGAVEQFNLSKLCVIESATPPDHYIPHRYSTTTPIYIGDSKLMAEEYVDYGEQKVYKRTENLFDASKGKSVQVETSGTQRFGNEFGILPVGTYTFVFSSNDTARRFFIVAYDNEEYSNFPNSGIFPNTPYTFNADGVKSYNIRTNVPSANSYKEIGTFDLILVKDSTAPTTYIPYLQPTTPPVPLPEISTYSGENTLSSTETVGEVSVTGKIKEVTT